MNTIALFTLIFTWAHSESAGVTRECVRLTPDVPMAEVMEMSVWDAKRTGRGPFPQSAAVRLLDVRAVADGCEWLPKPAREHLLTAPVAPLPSDPSPNTFPASVHWQGVDGKTAQCTATIVCGSEGRCEAIVDTDTCTAPWGLEQCLESTVAVPGDESADTLGCDPTARMLDIDWTPSL